MIVHTSGLGRRIFDMYDEEKIGCQINEYCSCCKNSEVALKLAGPISFFHIGLNFENDQHKIVFVGKNTWYDINGFKRDKVKIKGKCYANATKNGLSSLKREKNTHSNYWGYIIDIIKELYGNVETGMENIACTNIIKCNTTGEDGKADDKTPKEIRDSCVDSGIFQKEIEIMKPKHIIFLTGTDYDDAIKNFDFGCSKVIDGRKTRLNDGKIVKWPRELYHNGKLKYHILRTSHPQGKNKEAFISNIIDWINNTKIP
jgi:hypothetical protein